MSTTVEESSRTQSDAPDMDSTRTYNVLFLCTGNSARSILAEALLNCLGNGRFVGYSAGSRPTGRVHPFAIDCLRAQGLPVDNLRSKSRDEFIVAGAPEMDFVITVCDNAAGEVCPIWPGRPVTAHWGVPDPAALEGSDEVKQSAFRQAFHTLRHRIELLASLPVSTLGRQALSRDLRAIGSAAP